MIVPLAAATTAAVTVVIRASLEIPQKQSGRGKGQAKNKE